MAIRGSGADSEGSAFSPAEIGAIAHLYRAEVYRSTMWRTRLDNTTNWAVVTTGIALSLTYADADASPLPLFVVLLIVAVLGSRGRRRRCCARRLGWRVRSRA